MHTTSILLFALTGAVFSLPTFPLERRALIVVDPTISPTVDLSSVASCLGLGISVCDPINVGGTQNSGNTGSSTTTTTKKTVDTSDSSGSGTLIDLSPTVAPVIDLSSDGSCLGLGISACDPINVGGTQGSNNS